MSLDSTARHRWIGGVALATALAMLVGGETAFKGRLSDLGFLVYWLICAMLTGLAVMVAFLDVRALQRRTREEQRDLFEATLKKIVTEAASKPRQAGGAKPEEQAGREL